MGLTKVLVANRGEIAVRVLRAAADLSIPSVAIYAPSDIDSLAARMADEAFAVNGVGASPYLDIDQIMQIAARSGADAVHPGYGFLAESASFARAVMAAGLVWVGPPPEAIEALGDKVRARQIAHAVGAPLVPGSQGPVRSAEAALEWAKHHGLPVAIKAVHGGGGRGMRVARRLDEVAAQFEAATREANAAFGRSECFVERYLERPRHIEAQCLADRFGDVVVVSTRDCSVQRRHQKLVEEAPAPNLAPDQVSMVLTASKAILAEVGYVGAGTVEFLLGADGTLSFLEVNTRLQVEHPVTEQVTTIDLVTEMFRLAAGEPLGYQDPTPVGHAIEFRINAEDASRGFAPSPGRISAWEPPCGPGVRVDEGYRVDAVVPPEFDSLIAKLIVTGSDRTQAINRARRALAEFHIAGVATLLDFHRTLLDDPAFASSDGGFSIYTDWVDEVFVPRSAPPVASLAAPTTPDRDLERERVVVEVAGRRVEVLLPTARAPQRRPAARPRQTFHQVAVDGRTDEVRAVMSGTVLDVTVRQGQTVNAGAELLVLEAMKMEQPVLAPQAGIVADLRVSPGQPVNAGELLCRITGDQ